LVMEIGMTALTRLTRSNPETRYIPNVDSLRVRNPQLFVHPRSLREEQCGCGYPRTPCVAGKKYEDEEDIYRGNYCQREIDHQRNG
jgi:hypothetical protein